MIYTLVQSGRGWRPKPRRRNVPLVTLPVSDVASTAGAPTLPSGVSQCIWASPPRYALQRHENSAASARVRLAQPGYTELCEKIAEFKRDSVRLRGPDRREVGPIRERGGNKFEGPDAR